MIFDGWTSWTLREPTSPEPEPAPEPPPAPRPAPQLSLDPHQEDVSFAEKTIVNQFFHIIRETLGVRFPDAFAALLETLADYHDRGFPLRY